MIVRRLLTLLLLLAAASVQADSNTFAVHATTPITSLQPYMRFLLDPEQRYDYHTATANDQWQSIARSGFGYSQGAVWSRVTLVSGDGRAHTVILHNPRPGINYVDVYLQRRGEPLKHYALGLLRPLNEQPLPHRFTALPVELTPNEPVTITTRVQSEGPLEISWVVSLIGDFSRWSMGEHIIRGGLFGIVFAMTIYSLVLWWSLRQPVLLAYAIFGVLLQAVAFTYQGLYRIYNFGIDPSGFFYSLWLLACLMSIAMVKVGVYFFDTPHHLPRFHRWLQLLQVGLGLLCLVGVVTLFQHKQPVSPILFHIFLVLTYLSLLVVGIVGLWQRRVGALYYLLGHGSLLMAQVAAQMSILGLFSSFSTTTLAIPIGAVLDTIFLAKGIGDQLAQMRKTLAQQRESALVQSRFAALGKAIGMITHQWRRPLAQQGALLTELAMTLEHTPTSSLPPRVTSVLLPRMRDNLSLLSETVTEFRAYFGADPSRPRPYQPAEVISSSLALLSWQQRSPKIELVWSAPAQEIYLAGQPTTLAHVLMILLENANDIFLDRQIGAPMIQITLRDTAGTVSITVQDNGGGIEFQPVEQIFDSFVSGKQGHNTGMGLYFARLLIEEKMGGGIEARNIPGGACFTILLPHSV